MSVIDSVLSVLASPTPGIPLLIGGCSAGRTHALHAVTTRLGADMARTSRIAARRRYFGCFAAQMLSTRFG